MDSTCPTGSSDMLSNCELESPTQEAFSLLNNCSNADWNLLLQDGPNMVTQPERNDFINGGYCVPIDPGWNGVSNPSSGASCVPVYNQPLQPPPSQLPPSSGHELLQPTHSQILPQFLSPNGKPRLDFIPNQPLNPIARLTGGRLNDDGDSKQCQWSYQSSGYQPSQQYQPSSDLEPGKNSYFNDIDRYDIPKLSDFNPETNMINLTGSVTSDILKVVDSDDESDIIVEDSDTDSEISVTVIDDDPPIGSSSDLSCIVCDVSFKDVAAVNFVHINSTFPLTFVSKTPIVMKLIEFIPFDLQNLVKFENTLICRRCLNLIDTAENLEYRLTNIKLELCNFISKSKPLNGEGLVLPEPVQPRLPCVYQDSQPCLPSTSLPPVLPPNSQKDEENHSEGSEIDIGDSKTELQTLPSTQPSPSPESADGTPPEKNVDSARTPSPKPKTRKERRQGHFQCDRCGRTYRNKDNFSVHMAKHNKDFIFKCQHCFKGFTIEPYLQIHLRTHKDVRKYQCPDCPASFIQESDYKLHACSPTEKRFMCDDCPKAFKVKEKLEEHVAVIHHKDKHVCKECAKEFKNPSSLTAHMKSHTEAREFKCEKCHASYKSLSHLNRHLTNSHGPEKKKIKNDVDKKFECPECGKLFADKRYLKQHEKLHDGGAKMNECPICYKTFRISLKIHMTSHMTKKPMFKCEDCASEFSYKQGLMKHLRLKHRKEERKVNSSD